MIAQDFIEKCQKIALDYLQTKKRKNYYLVSIFSNFNNGELTYFEDIDDEDVAIINEMKEKYGKDFVKHLDETFEPDYFISLDAEDELLDIITDKVFYMYDFEARGFDGDKVVSRRILLNLSDEEYAKLVALHLWCDWLTINKLPDFDEKLSDTIHRQAMAALKDDDGSFDLAGIPFTLIMTEAVRDADAIRKQSKLSARAEEG